MAFYTDAQRQVQAQLNSTELAERMAAAIISDSVSEDNAAFISTRDFFFLSTVNGRGEPSVSYKGGDVGVVTVASDRQLLFPSYDGNGMCLSLGNIVDTGKIGMLFIDLETPHRLRVQATATVSQDDDLMQLYPGADAVVAADVTEVFVNCARLIHRYERVESSRYVPDADGNMPLATWKRVGGFGDVLRPGDADRVDEAGGPITVDEYRDRVRNGTS